MLTLTSRNMPLHSATWGHCRSRCGLEEYLSWIAGHWQSAAKAGISRVSTSGKITDRHGVTECPLRALLTCAPRLSSYRGLLFRLSPCVDKAVSHYGALCNVQLLALDHARADGRPLQPNTAPPLLSPAHRIDACNGTARPDDAQTGVGGSALARQCLQLNRRRPRAQTRKCRSGHAAALRQGGQSLLLRRLM